MAQHPAVHHDHQRARRHRGFSDGRGLGADGDPRLRLLIRTLAGERRYRIWRVYLAGCAYAFDKDWISLYQIVCAKAGQSATALPWSREYMYRQAAATESGA